MSAPEERSLRANFFHLIWRDRTGYVCIASDTSIKGDFKQRFFQWPAEEGKMLTHIETLIPRNRNIWFGVNLLKNKVRNKETVLPTNLIWADLDACPPDAIEPRPQVAIESSPKHYQAIWMLDETLDVGIAEDYSRRLAYRYEELGADTGCWNADRLLRVPYTFNVKEIYPDHPKVRLLSAVDTLVPTVIFDGLSDLPVTESDVELDESIPELGDAEAIIVRHISRLSRTDFSNVWGFEPTEKDDWSKLLWRLLLSCFEAGMTKEEAYTVGYASDVNKYKRDNRPDRYLWRDVVKAHGSAVSMEIITNSARFDMPELIPGDDYKFKKKSFIDEYVEWGKEATDAPEQYHELGAFILLSSLLSGNINLTTSWGKIRPNLWGLILGESSLTRKSTAKNMVQDIIDFVDRDILLATDGSSEGILAAISGRAGRTSMFIRDEVVGLVNEMANKQYLAGIPQMFTQLYDGQFIARKLRKETITVTDPVFLFFGCGIKEQFCVAANEDFVSSGFLPRFLIVSGETELSQLRRLGPASNGSVDKRQEIYAKANKMYKDYVLTHEVEILGEKAMHPQVVEVEMSDDAWELNGDIAHRMTEAAYNSMNPNMALPTFERLSGSMLKMSMLLAASRQLPEDGKIQLVPDDIRRSAKYVQEWGQYSIDVVLNLGQTANMRAIERVRKYVNTNPGVARSLVMQHMSLNKRQITEIEETLEARGEIRVESSGRGKIYVPTV